MIGRFTYKKYFGSIAFDTEEKLYFGKIDGISDLVLFDGDTIEEIKSTFKEAVEDYIKVRKEIDIKYHHINQ